MKILKELSRKEFRDKFGTEDQCLAYLALTKWGEEYTCRKCKNERFIAGKKKCNRRFIIDKAAVSIRRMIKLWL